VGSGGGTVRLPEEHLAAFRRLKQCFV
jgi:hypothetical protein